MEHFIELIDGYRALLKIPIFKTVAFILVYKLISKIPPAVNIFSGKNIDEGKMIAELIESYVEKNIEGENDIGCYTKFIKLERNS